MSIRSFTKWLTEKPDSPNWIPSEGKDYCRRCLNDDLHTFHVRAIGKDAEPGTAEAWFHAPKWAVACRACGTYYELHRDVTEQ
ncbi:hypothetical protein AB1L42_19320 [Thalassoglobus sp. JC818]|uniref:hypothetical protein n=1 Tax=Thalassoglobus sp. JC818 TaxID=3232136 RepID=UPI0034589B52